MQKWRQDCLAVQAQGEDLGNCSPVASSATDGGVSILGVNNIVGECRELLMWTLMTSVSFTAEQRNGTNPHSMMCFPHSLAIPASHQKALG